jgi:hypothetical protein
LGIPVVGLFVPIADLLREKGEKIIQANKACTQAGYDGREKHVLKALKISLYRRTI